MSFCPGQNHEYYSIYYSRYKCFTRRKDPPSAIFPTLSFFLSQKRDMKNRERKVGKKREEKLIEKTKAEKEILRWIDRKKRRRKEVMLNYFL